MVETECSTGLPGLCARGLSTCKDGSESCNPTLMASANEVECDGIDEDCDGMVDEGLRDACGRCESWNEVCNGEDEDCDGNIDENVVCEDGRLCFEGECVSPCSSGECPLPFQCRNDICLSPCQITPCEAGFTCNVESGECESLCESECAEGQSCSSNGECVDVNCFNLGCEEGQVCSSDGTCVDDPCNEVMCPDMTFCREGECVGSCALISCSLNEICVDGQCLDLTCGGVLCLDYETCNENNECETDPCVNLSCEEGQACVDGECQGDPCLGITCPPGGRCEVVQDSAQCVGDETALEPPPEEYQEPIADSEGGMMMMGGMTSETGGMMDVVEGGTGYALK